MLLQIYSLWHLNVISDPGVRNLLPDGIYNLRGGGSGQLRGRSETGAGSVAGLPSHVVLQEAHCLPTNHPAAFILHHYR